MILALAGFGWIAVFALMGDALHDALGDAAFAITFIAACVAITAIIVAVLFRRFVTVRTELIAGTNIVARWRIDDATWRAFAVQAGNATRADHRMTLALIVGFAVVICALFAAIHPRDAVIFLWIGLGICAVGVVGYGLGRRAMANHLAFRGGEVIIGRRGLMVNGVLHVWGYVSSRLDDIEHHDTEWPNRLTFTYSWVSRTGRQYWSAHVPLPTDRAETRALLEKLANTWPTLGAADRPTRPRPASSRSPATRTDR